jgi:hypothetical protein
MINVKQGANKSSKKNDDEETEAKIEGQFQEAQELAKMVCLSRFE